jgi:hypothetical protein
VSAIIGANPASLVQRAVYALLNVASFKALSPIVDTTIPQGTATPYTWLTFGDPQWSPEHQTFGRLGGVVRLKARVYSTFEGDKEVTDILSKASELLNDKPLTVTGWSVFMMQALFATVDVLEVEGAIWRSGELDIDVHLMKDL